MIQCLILWVVENQAMFLCTTLKLVIWQFVIIARRIDASMTLFPVQKSLTISLIGFLCWRPQITQGSAEWINDRIGKPTGSRIGDIMARTKTGPSERRKKYMRELLCERLTGRALDHFVSDAMQWGIDNEPYAAAAYEARTGVMLKECGFFEHPIIKDSGATPDRLIGDDGVLEIKCPNTMTHINTILTGEIDYDYLCQMTYEIDSTGREWADFVSYDSRLPGDLAYFCKRYFPQPEFIEEIRAEVIKFISELDALEAKLREYRP